MKRKITLLLAIIMITALLSGSAAVSNTVSVTVNGQAVSFSMPPSLSNGTTMTPCAELSQALSLDLTYDTETETLGISSLEHSIAMEIGSRTAETDGGEITLPKAPYISGGCIYVPLRAVCETMGAAVQWDGGYGIVRVQFEPPFSKLTDDYPIIVVPGTFGSVSEEQLLLFSDYVNDISTSPIVKILVSTIMPLIDGTLSSYVDGKSEQDPAYRVETFGKGYMIDPFIDCYRDLFRYFDEKGLERDSDYFIFGYDSVGAGIEKSAADFDRFVDDVLRRTGAEKVNILAHSQGALLSRCYIQKDANYKNVSVLFCVGAPNHGCMTAYELVNNVYSERTIRYSIALSLLSFIAEGSSGEESKQNIIAALIASVYDMIPIYEPQYSDSKNDFLRSLNTSESLAALAALGRGNVVNLIGVGCDTTESIYDGKPVYSDDGDATVLRKSSRLPGFPLVALEGVSHADYFREGSKFYDYVDVG